MPEKASTTPCHHLTKDSHLRLSGFIQANPCHCMCSRVAGLSKGRGAYTDGGRTGRGKVKGADTEGHRPQPQGLRRVAIGASRTWWPLCRISGEVPPMISVCNSKGCFSRALPEPTGNLMSVHAPGCNSLENNSSSFCIASSYQGCLLANSSEAS